MSAGLLLVSQPDGQSYFQLEYFQAKQMYYAGAISPEQYIWCIARNQWVAARDYFQEAKKQSVRLMTEYAKKTQTAAIAVARQASDVTKKIVSASNVGQRRAVPAGQVPVQQRRVAGASARASLVAEKKPSVVPVVITGFFAVVGVGLAVASKVVPMEMLDSTMNTFRPMFMWVGGCLAFIMSIPCMVAIKRLFSK